MHKSSDVEYDIIYCLILYEDDIFCRWFTRSRKLHEGKNIKSDKVIVAWLSYLSSVCLCKNNGRDRDAVSGGGSGYLGGSKEPCIRWVAIVMYSDQTVIFSVTYR